MTSNYPNNGIYVAFEEVDWDVTVSDAAGVTTNWQFGSFGGGVDKVDIFLNGVDFTWATSGADSPGATVSDIQSVVAHEIGHAIGLDHSRTRTATMWFTTYPGQAEAAQSLDPDDKRAACFLYPATSFDDGLVCDACFDSSDCANGVCLGYGDEGAFCGQACSATNGCPEGYSCYQIQGLQRRSAYPITSIVPRWEVTLGLVTFAMTTPHVRAVNVSSSPIPQSVRLTAIQPPALVAQRIWSASGRALTGFVIRKGTELLVTCVRPRRIVSLLNA